MATYKSDMMGRTCVYRAFIGDQLAYIGISRSPLGRFAKHRHQKSWWRQVSRIEIEWFPTRADAFVAETAAIAAEDPIHNIARPRLEV